MLLLFCFCILYPFRFKKIILLSIILFFLSETNVHSLIIVISIFISLLLEIILKRKKIINEFANRYHIIAGLTLIAIGIAISIIQIYPDSSSVVFHGLPPLNVILKSIFSSAIFPGSPIIFHRGYIYNLSLNVKFIIFIGLTIIMWMIYIFLLRKPFILIIFFASVVGLGMFSELVYSFDIRHKGFLFLLVIMAFWLDAREVSEVRTYPTQLNKLIAFLSKNKVWFITSLLVTQVFMGSYAVINEIKTDFSYSKKAGSFINEDYNLKQAIIIGEPDYLIESLPYYINNPIYIPRESHFGKAVRFTKKNKTNYSLIELLNTAIKLHLEFHKPILIFMGHRLTKKGPYKISYGYGNNFYYDNESLEKFNKLTIKIDSFREGGGDENYDVFLLD